MFQKILNCIEIDSQFAAKFESTESSNQDMKPFSKLVAFRILVTLPFFALVKDRKVFLVTIFNCLFGSHIKPFAVLLLGQS